MSPLVLFIAVATGMLLIGYFAGRGQDEEGYNLYNRSLPRKGYLVSYAATYIGAGFFIAGTAWIYSYGLGIFWVIAGLILGGFIFGFFAQWLKKQTDHLKLHTLPDFFRWRFGKTSAWILTAITLFILSSDIAVQLVGGGKLLQTLGVMDYSTSVFITVAVVMGYLMLSGFRAVIWTDYVLLSAILLLTAILAFVSSGDFHPVLNDFSSAGVPTGAIVGMLVFGIFEPFAISTYYQRIFAADSPETAKKGTWFGSLAIILPVLGLFVIGVAARKLFPGIDPDIAFLKIIETKGRAIAIVGSLVLWAALMSTIDTVTFAASQILNKDLLRRPLTRKNMSVGIALFLGIGLIFSFALPSVMDAGLLFLAGGMVIAPPAFFQWFIRFKEPSVLAALLSGIAIIVLYVFVRGIDTALVAATFFTSAIVLLVTHSGSKLIQRLKQAV